MSSLSELAIKQAREIGFHDFRLGFIEYRTDTPGRCSGSIVFRVTSKGPYVAELVEISLRRMNYLYMVEIDYDKDAVLFPSGGAVWSVGGFSVTGPTGTMTTRANGVLVEWDNVPPGDAIAMLTHLIEYLEVQLAAPDVGWRAVDRKGADIAFVRVEPEKGDAEQ